MKKLLLSLTILTAGYNQQAGAFEQPQAQYAPQQLMQAPQAYYQPQYQVPQNYQPQQYQAPQAPQAYQVVPMPINIPQPNNQYQPAENNMAAAQPPMDEFERSKAAYMEILKNHPNAGQDYSIGGLEPASGVRVIDVDQLMNTNGIADANPEDLGYK